MSHYVHGTSAQEQDRLARMNELINRSCTQALRLAGERRVLDVGCGLAQLTRAVAAELGEGARLVGIERDPTQLAEARRRARDAPESSRIELRAGRAEELPLAGDEPGSFDLAYARFLLEHHPRPASVVAEMVRAVRPGGRVALFDDDHDLLRLWPEPAGVLELWRAYVRLYERNGCDPYVGRRLVELLTRAGARPVRCDWIFYGACSGSEPFRGLVANLVGVFQSAERQLVEQDLTSAPRFASALAALAEWEERPDAALWYAISYAEGVRPAAAGASAP